MRLLKRTGEGELINQAVINWDLTRGAVRLVISWRSGFLYSRLRWRPLPPKLWFKRIRYADG